MQLCLALADLVVQMASWTNAVEDLINRSVLLFQLSPHLSATSNYWLSYSACRPNYLPLIVYMKIVVTHDFVTISAYRRFIRLLSLFLILNSCLCRPRCRKCKRHVGYLCVLESKAFYGLLQT